MPKDRAGTALPLWKKSITQSGRKNPLTISFEARPAWKSCANTSAPTAAPIAPAIWNRQKNSGVTPLKPNQEQSRDGSATPKFTPEQLAWLELIRDHIATAISIEPNDFNYAPFSQRGGLGKAHQLFGDGLPKLLDELNEVLAA
jgi:hypothetical protein